MVDIAEARKLILSHCQTFGVERVALGDSLGRILAEPLTADRDYPPFNRCAMDGYALRAGDLVGEIALQLIYDLRAGDIFSETVLPGQCVRVMTGAPLPRGADTVIPSEQARDQDGQVWFSLTHPVPGRHIASQGEDALRGQVLLGKGQLITPAVLGTLAMVGCGRPLVAGMLGVRVFSTGNEVKPPGSSLEPHHIRDVNGYVLGALFQHYGLRVLYTDPLRDDPAVLREAFGSALDARILVITGGVSKGASDLTAGVLESLGVRPLFHRVKIRPGSPLWVGISGQGSLVFALPGNPVSARVGFKVFIEPYLRACFGMSPLQPLYHPMTADRKARSAMDEYFPATLRTVAGCSRVEPVPINGSGDSHALVYSSGVALHPAAKAWLEAGEPVEYFPWTTPENVLP